MTRRRKRTPSAWRVERQLIRYVYEFPDITRQELAARLGQSPAAISLVIRRLLNSGWLRESGRAVSLGGRRPVQLRLSAQKALIVGQSVTSNWIRSVVVNPDGEVLAQVEAEPEASSSDLQARMAKSLHEAVRKAKIDSDQIVGVGVALSGVVYGDTGLARSFAGVHEPTETNFLDFVEKQFPDKVHAVDHVARSRLTWEVYQNSALREQTAILLDLGHEIDAALSVFGVAYRGTDGAPLDVGGVPVSPTGRGGAKTTTLREVAALDRIVGRAAAEMEHGGKAVLLRDMLGSSPQGLTASLIARAAQAGDSVSYRIASDVSEAVGEAIGALCSMLRPRTVLFSGLLVTCGLLNLDEVRRTVRLTVEPDVFDNLRLTVSEAEEWGAANGVAHLVLRKWLDSLAPNKDGALPD